MKEIELSQGYVALVDDEDYQRLSAYSWHVKVDERNVYARRNIETPDGRRTTLAMHRQILSALPGMEVDHLDGDGLNNQRSNLRLCTRSENQRNRHKRVASSSRFKGIYWEEAKARWRAMIRTDEGRQYLGSFDNEEEAARAYNEAAIRYHGEFANLNDISSTD